MLYPLLAFQKYVVLEKPRDFKVLENKEKLPWSIYVGVCGMPGEHGQSGRPVTPVAHKCRLGETAYYAWKEYAKSQKVRSRVVVKCCIYNSTEQGDVVYVSTASGAVGAYV